MIYDPAIKKLLMSKFVTIGNGCWLWLGKPDRDGYGRICINRKARLAHRVSYTHYVGPIQAGKEIDHLCRNRICINPSHLEPVSHRENMERGLQASKTHCKNGHEFTKKNTYLRPGNSGKRGCRACNAIAAKKYAKGKPA